MHSYNVQPIFWTIQKLSVRLASRHSLKFHGEAPDWQTWICSISSGANSFCPSPPKNSFRSPPVLPSTSRSMKKSRSCSTPKIRCFNCVNNGYGSKKFMINLISIICLYLKFHHVVSFLLFRKIIWNYDLNAWSSPLWQGLILEWSKAAFKEGNSPPQVAP